METVCYVWVWPLKEIPGTIVIREMVADLRQNRRLKDRVSGLFIAKRLVFGGLNEEDS